MLDIFYLYYSLYITTIVELNNNIISLLMFGFNSKNSNHIYIHINLATTPLPLNYNIT